MFVVVEFEIDDGFVYKYDYVVCWVVFGLDLYVGCICCIVDVDWVVKNDGWVILLNEFVLDLFDVVCVYVFN